MAKKFLDLKKIKPTIKDTVFGYMRQLSKSSLYGENIPKLIEHLCLEYYYIYDEWDKQCMDESIILDDTNTIKQGAGRGGSGTSTFLKEIISSGEFEWKFKIGKQGIPGSYSSTIGIWKITDKRSEKSVVGTNCFNKHDKKLYVCGYAFDIAIIVSGQTRINYGKKCVTKDIITMTLDLNKLELKYKVNGEDQGKAFDIKPGAYRAVVNMSTHGDSITLL